MRISTSTLIILFFISCSNTNDPYLLLNKIRQVSDFATTEVTIKKYILANREKKILFVKFADAKFAAEAHATLKFGIDLKRITQKNLTIEGKTAIVSVPQIKLVSFSMPPELTTEIPALSDRVKFLNTFKFRDIEEAYLETSNQIGESIEYLNIQEKVVNNTEVALTGLLKPFEIDQVIVNLEDNEIDISKYF